MNKETLMAYLCNKPLVRAIKQKNAVIDTRSELLSALSVLETVGANKAVIKEVRAKFDEYEKIKKSYETLLESAFCVTWQKENIIRKYMNCLDDDIDKLPDEINA